MTKYYVGAIGGDQMISKAYLQHDELAIEQTAPSLLDAIIVADNQTYYFVKFSKAVARVGGKLLEVKVQGNSSE